MAALTEREQKVKRILLQELERINKKSDFGFSFTYAERQHLVKRIDFAYIDKQLAKMRRDYKSRLFWYRIFLPIVGVISAVIFGDAIRHGLSTDALQLATDRILQLVLSGMYLPLGIFSARRDLTALQRKIFIYEALRELSDVDESDLLLDQSVQQADQLIDRLVERQLEMERLYPVSLIKENSIPVRERVHH